MQRNRNVRKVIQPPNAVAHTTNIQRKTTTRNFEKVSHIQAARTRLSKTIGVVNSEKPMASKIKYSTVQNKFQNETIYIIGGGPSLENFDFSKLAGRVTIAINKAIIFHNIADVLYWTDTRFYTWFKNEVDNYKGLKFSLTAGSQYTDDVNILKKGKIFGLETDPQTLAHGNNSGYAAINLAYHLGATRIILLGFDMGSNSENTHFHDGYPAKAAPNSMYEEKFIPGFNQLNSEIKDSGVTILNASPISKLRVFPKITIEQALSFR
jgi:hypothetical protein|tara:strand:- start:125 stop:922 length:798 start_codon:yes stop_codon:yes gene_type:complete